jgi:two-component system invasion response regulator UvrY
MTLVNIVAPFAFIDFLVKEHCLIKVLIVDDHALVRMGIRRLLDDLPDMQVVAEAENGEVALVLVKTHQPDVVLLDMKMPGIDGWEVTRRLKKSNPHIKIIAVTAMCSESLPTRVLQLGAMGYLTKESGVEEMAAAIRKVYKGERYLSAEIAQKIAISSLQTSQESPFDLLSEREMQVMLMITSGMTVQDISDRLFLSSKTINGYRYRMFEKLGIKNDVELTYLAMKHRVIERPTDALDNIE